MKKKRPTILTYSINFVKSSSAIVYMRIRQIIHHKSEEVDLIKKTFLGKFSKKTLYSYSQLFCYHFLKRHVHKFEKKNIEMHITFIKTFYSFLHVLSL